MGGASIAVQGSPRFWHFEGAKKFHIYIQFLFVHLKGAELPHKLLIPLLSVVVSVYFPLLRARCDL